MSEHYSERRVHRRYQMRCPIRLSAGEGLELINGKTANISDGGALLAVTEASMPAPGRELKVDFLVPRSTANTFMLEGFSCNATVVRRQPMNDDKFTGLAIKFSKPLALAIEV